MTVWFKSSTFVCFDVLETIFVKARHWPIQGFFKLYQEMFGTQIYFSLPRIFSVDSFEHPRHVIIYPHSICRSSSSYKNQQQRARGARGNVECCMDVSMLEYSSYVTSQYATVTVNLCINYKCHQPANVEEEVTVLLSPVDEDESQSAPTPLSFDSAE